MLPRAMQKNYSKDIIKVVIDGNKNKNSSENDVEEGHETEFQK